MGSQKNTWKLEDDLCAYRCQCGKLWFGDEQAGQCMGDECPNCIGRNRPVWKLVADWCVLSFIDGLRFGIRFCEFIMKEIHDAR